MPFFLPHFGSDAIRFACGNQIAHQLKSSPSYFSSRRVSIVRNQNHYSSYLDGSINAFFSTYLFSGNHFPLQTNVYYTPPSCQVHLNSKVSPTSVRIAPTLPLPTTLSSFIASHLENNTLTLHLSGSARPSPTVRSKNPPATSL